MSSISPGLPVSRLRSLTQVTARPCLGPLPALRWDATQALRGSCPPGSCALLPDAVFCKPCSMGEGASDSCRFASTQKLVCDRKVMAVLEGRAVFRTEGTVATVLPRQEPCVGIPACAEEHPLGLIWEQSGLY